MRDRDITILIATHKPAYFPNNKNLLPIQAGAAIANNKIPDIEHDDIGKNISNKNERYCELTALYWAWKNINSNYYGLWHYRRYMSFKDDDKLKENIYGEHEIRKNISDAISDIGLDDDDKMSEFIRQHDLILPNKGGSGNGEKIYEHYIANHYKGDMDICLNYIRANYPEIADYIELAFDQECGYMRNMFIAKKEIFDNYCSFLFDVLAHFDKENDCSDYNVQQYRVDGYLGERLTNLYMTYLINEKKDLKWCELKSVYFWNTDEIKAIEPIRKSKSVPVVLAIDDNYVPYTSALIHSIAENSSADYIYDVIIFNRNISQRNMQLLKSEFSTIDNISIRFYDISSYVAKCGDKITVRGHWSVETYFRLFIQDILSDYDKAIYLDADLIVLSDLAELYNVKIDNGYLLAAAKDPDSAGLYCGAHPGAEEYFNTSQLDLRKQKYVDDVLKLKNPYDYFQAGVLLLNLVAIRKEWKNDKAINLALSREWELQDQDVLNVLADGKVTFLDMSWNVMFDWKYKRLKNVISLAPHQLYKEYIEAHAAPKIIHYAAPDKPWNNPECDYGYLFWKYARMSVFYETILSRMIDCRSYNKAAALLDYDRFIHKIRPRLGRVKRKIIAKIKK